MTGRHPSHERRPRRPGQGSHQPCQSDHQGHQGAVAEEEPRRDRHLPGRRAEAGDRRARSWLDDPHAGLCQGGQGQAAGREGRGADRGRRRAGARSQRKGAGGHHPARQSADGRWRVRTAPGAAVRRFDRPPARPGWRSTGFAIPAISAPSSAPPMRPALPASSWSAKPPTRSRWKRVRATMGSVFAVPMVRARRRGIPRVAKKRRRAPRRHPSGRRRRLPHDRLPLEARGPPDGQRAGRPAGCAGRGLRRAGADSAGRARRLASTSPSPPASCCSRRAATF